MCHITIPLSLVLQQSKQAVKAGIIFVCCSVLQGSRSSTKGLFYILDFNRCCLTPRESPDDTTRCCLRQYENTPMQYTAIFHGCENQNFQFIFFFTIFIFLLKTYTVGTRKNRLIKAVLTSTHNIYFRAKIRK